MQLVCLDANELNMVVLHGEECTMLVVFVTHPQLFVEVVVDIDPAVFGQLVVLVFVRIVVEVELAQSGDVLLPEGTRFVYQLVIDL